MFNRWRKLAKHLEQHGRRAPATVVAIAKEGSNVSAEGYGPMDAIRNVVPGRTAGDSLAPSNSAGYAVRKARIRIEPPDGPPIEIERRMRFGDWGRYVPKAGERIEVVYDPEDPEKVMVAPPTAEEEQARTAAALGEAKVGFTLGGGAKGSGEPVTDETMAEHRQAMDQAQQLVEQAQQFMSGGRKPGEASPEQREKPSDDD